MVRIQRVLELRKRAKSRLRPPWRNTDARKTVKLADGSFGKKNFNIYYEIDDDGVKELSSFTSAPFAAVRLC